MQNLHLMSLGFSISLLLVLRSSTITMADDTHKSSEADAAAAAHHPRPAPSTAVYIVYTDQPREDVDPESHHLRTLSSVLGSEEAAKASLLYVYKTAATGFSAKLTPEQVSEISKQPGVLYVAEDMKLELHSGGGMNFRNC